MPLPKFIQPTDEQWRAELLTNQTWAKDESKNIAPGGSGGFMAINDDKTISAWLKPTVPYGADHPIAANEKIAYDLAYELNLSVPPALLYNREVTGEEKKTVLSMVVFPEVYEWEKILNLAKIEPLIRGIVQTTLAKDSGLVAFDVYLGQTDRHNGRNVLFGTHSDFQAEGCFLFLDFGNSMNYNNAWETKEKWQSINPPNFPTILRESLDKRVLEEAIDKIRDLDVDVIDEIVKRIPEEYMSLNHKTKLTEALTGRRKLVADYVQSEYLK